MSKVVRINKNIDKLTHANIVSAGKPVDDGAQALTVPVSIIWEDGEKTNAYLKCFPEIVPASLVNEVTGFVVGTRCGLPLPRKMGFIELPEKFSEGYGLLKWGVVVSELPGQSLKAIWKVQNCDQAVLDILLQELFSWVSVENMLAFDDWMANTDRHIGNIIFRSPGSYSLIDHSDMPVRQGWSVQELDPYGQFDSRLGKIYNYAKRSGDDEKNKLRKFAGQHRRVYAEVEAELLHWWREALFLAGGQEFVDERLPALSHFFKARADDSIRRVENNETLLKAG